jgi:hypothetical protein
MVFVKAWMLDVYNAINIDVINAQCQWGLKFMGLKNKCGYLISQNDLFRDFLNE